MSNDENTHGLIADDIIDGPLIIVLDDDDDDELEEDFHPLITTIVTDTEDEDVLLENPCKLTSNTKSKVFNRTNNPPEQSTKPIRPILIDTSFTQPSNHQQRRKKRKIPPSLTIDSILSYITFDNVSDVLTVSRMGSVYYCVEDLYLKIFASLCTFDELIDLLFKPLKQVTLSEKISLSQQNSGLKKLHPSRYRLISMDSSDYLLKLKQLLITNNNHNRIEEIIKEIQSYKQTSISNRLHDKSSKKRLKNVTNKQTPDDFSPLPIVLECDPYSPDNPDTLNDKPNSPVPSRRKTLYRSKSLTHDRKKIRSRFFSLSSMKFHVEDRIVLKVEPIDPIDDYYSMPMIVNIEENVHVDNLMISNSIDLSDPFPYLHPPSSDYLTSIQTLYDLYYPDLNPPSPEKLKQSFPIIVSILEKPIYQRLLTSEKSPLNCVSSCSRSSSPFKTIPPDERMTSEEYAAKFPSLLHRKQDRWSPYPKTQTYFAPLPSRHMTTNKSAPVNRKPTSSIHLSRAIIEHNNCEIDKIPKLVIRHTKTYQNKTIDNMGQLFPSWFDEPDYRCIHCFNCDCVYTPELFMTHVDDKRLTKEQPLNMTPIQLLTSEKMSSFKVGLWNQFCTNLKNYASKFPEAMKRKNLWKAFN